MARVVFVRGGWMREYGRWDDPEDEPIGGGSFNDDDVGSEVNNFAVLRRRVVLGYTRIDSEDRGFNLPRLDGDDDDESVDGVTVVLVARRPQGGQVVVGWHKNAECFGRDGDRSEHDPNAYGAFVWRAHARDCVLLPLHERTWDVPKEKGAFGQANVCYLHDGKRATPRPWATKILKRIAHYEGANWMTDRPQYALGVKYRRANERPQSKQPEIFVRDPDALDRSTSKHAKTQNALSDFLEQHEFLCTVPKADEPQYDLGATDREGYVWVVEVKSIKRANEVHQLRLGLGQVLEYRARLEARYEEVRAVLAVSRVPADADTWTSICESVGVTLVWPETFDRLLE